MAWYIDISGQNVDFKLFFTKKRFSQNRVFDTSSNFHVTDLRNGATLSLTFFLSVSLGCLLGPLLESKRSIHFLKSYECFFSIFQKIAVL